MHKKPLFLFISIVILCATAPAMGKDTTAPKPVIERSKEIFSHGADSFAESPIQGLFQVTSGITVIYISADGKFAIEGDIFDLENEENLTERKRNRARMDAIDSLGEKDMIVFAPGDVRHTITVFTDVDCGYCRKLHNEVPILKDTGIKVRYLGFPRAGPSSDTYSTMVSVWCADDREKAMTDAKKGNLIPAKQCTHPLKEHLALGKRIGVRGTPAIVLEDGTLISGYVPAIHLQDILEKTFHK
ncbi:MAG: thiol:disulfide interchange protein DsbC [Candidatus Kentron sp. G]|nr:MAG: thiol:disulfide interchange protein DsbC [Candidatus Kentron sp. G]VFN00279.1 MAG: thiol:disulfide interchange protein DsbC [Candidatus Kentron sp. G]